MYAGGQVTNRLVNGVWQKVAPVANKVPEGVKPIANGKTSAPLIGQKNALQNLAKNIEPNLKINQNQQNKHIVGTNEYKTASMQTPRNPLADGVDPQLLVYKYAGKGQAANKIPIGQPGSVERISTPNIIGAYYENGVYVGPTTNFTIRYAKDGVHIIPSRPTK